MVIGVGERKTRSDIKKDVKPTIRIELKDAIYRLSYITQTAVKDVVAVMIEYAMNDSNTISNLSKHFKRDVRINNTLFIGNLKCTPISKRETGDCERVSTRLKSNTYHVVAAFAYALDSNPSRVSAILLNAAMHDINFINGYVKKYLDKHITESQMRELKEILKYINKDINTHHSWASLLSLIVDEVSLPVTKVKAFVNEYIIKNWRDK